MKKKKENHFLYIAVAFCSFIDIFIKDWKTDENLFLELFEAWDVNTSNIYSIRKGISKIETRLSKLRAK